MAAHPGTGPRKTAPAPGSGPQGAWYGEFSEGLAPVRIGGLYGYVDTSGRMAVPPRYGYGGRFSQGRAAVLDGDRWGYIDVSGRGAIPAAFDWAGMFSGGRAAVAADGAHFFIDTAGNALGRLRFSDTRPFSDGLAAVRFGDAEDGAWGFIDSGGRLAIPPLFADVPRGFSGGYAAVVVGGEGGHRAGFIDTSGGFVTDSLFDAAGDFSEGLAPVGRGEFARGRFEGTWSYVDTTGARAFAGDFEWAGAFEKGRAMVRARDGSHAFVDRSGAFLGKVPDSLVPPDPRPPGSVTYKVR